MGLVTLSPGVSAANSFNSRDKGLAGGSDFSVNGNPYTNNLFLVDGVNNNDMGSNRTILVYPSVDAIAEFKMLRNSYGPEYGQASGAIISINTKSGENQFHGGIFYAGRNDALNANDWFSNNNGTGQAKLRRNDYGYNASGPIIKIGSLSGGIKNGTKRFADSLSRPAYRLWRKSTVILVRGSVAVLPHPTSPLCLLGLL
jgi:hypothetical protein